MIYTITFNPALDYIAQVENFEIGQINRTKTEKILPGGKGLNVSTVLKNLGLENTALGFIAGFTGKELKRKIEEYGKSGVSIPLGSFTGIPLFVGRGPKIKLKVNPIGAVNCSFLSQFETAGINQTNHKIYLKISADVGVVLPLLSTKYNTTRQVLISESIIVGEVQEVYLYSDTLDTLLNFVPY